MLKRIHIPLEVVIAALVIAVNIFVVFAPENSLMNWYTTDDAFYYFKTAQNITEGHGISFDGIGRSSGFHPLWMMVCIPVFSLARFNLFLPLRILAVISILLAAGSGALLFKTLKRALSKEASFLIALFWVMNPDIHYVTTQLGMESSINAFFSIFLVYMVSQFEGKDISGQVKWQDIFKISLVAILTLLSRLDNVFLVLLVGVWVVLRRTNVRYLLLADWILAAASVFCSFLLRLGFREAYEKYIPAAVTMLAVGLFINTIVFYLSGFYGCKAGENPYRYWIRVGLGVSASGMVNGIVMLALQRSGILPGFPRTSILLNWGFTLAFIVATRWIFRKINGNPALLPPEAPENRVGTSLKTWIMDALPYFVPLGVALALYMAGNYLYFGTPMPVSGQIKHWWGTLYTVYGRPVDSLWRLFGFTNNLNGGTWGTLFYFQNNAAELAAKLAHIRKESMIQQLAYWFGATFFLISIWLVALNFRHILKAFNRLAIFPLLVGNFAQIFYYNGTNYVNMRPWYWVTQILFSAFLIALVVEALVQSLRNAKLNETAMKVATVITALLLVAGLVAMLVDLVPMKIPAKKVKSYLGGMVALEQATEPGSLIGSTGGGVIAYFIKNRTIVNLDGLMNSKEYFDLMKANKGYKYLDKLGVTYIYGNKYMVTDSEPFVGIFKDRLKDVGMVGGSMLFYYGLKKSVDAGG